MSLKVSTLQIATKVSFTRVWKTLNVQPYLGYLDDSNEEPHNNLLKKGLQINRTMTNSIAYISTQRSTEGEFFGRSRSRRWQKLKVAVEILLPFLIQIIL